MIKHQTEGRSNIVFNSIKVQASEKPLSEAADLFIEHTKFDKVGCLQKLMPL